MASTPKRDRRLLLIAASVLTGAALLISAGISRHVYETRDITA